MPRQEVVIEVSKSPRLAQDLAAGGGFVPGYSCRLNDECVLVVRGTSSESRLVARVVYSDGARGTGFELAQLDERTQAELVEVIGASITLPLRQPVSNPPMPRPAATSRRTITAPPVASPMSVELPQASSVVAVGIPSRRSPANVLPELELEPEPDLELELELDGPPNG
jgi:hypothetical protein